MKTRQGFVSNSSSSSFVIVTTKEVATQAKVGLSPYELIVVEFLESKVPPFCGNEIVLYHHTSGNQDVFEYFKATEHGYKKGSDENELNGPHDVWYAFVEKVKKLGVGKTIQHRESY